LTDRLLDGGLSIPAQTELLTHLLSKMAAQRQNQCVARHSRRFTIEPAACQSLSTIYLGFRALRIFIVITAERLYRIEKLPAKVIGDGNR